MSNAKKHDDNDENMTLNEILESIRRCIDPEEKKSKSGARDDLKLQKNHQHSDYHHNDHRFEQSSEMTLFEEQEMLAQRSNDFAFSKHKPSEHASVNQFENDFFSDAMPDDFVKGSGETELEVPLAQTKSNDYGDLGHHSHHHHHHDNLHNHHHSHHHEGARHDDLSHYDPDHDGSRKMHHKHETHKREEDAHSHHSHAFEKEQEKIMDYENTDRLLSKEARESAQQSLAKLAEASYINRMNASRNNGHSHKSTTVEGLMAELAMPLIKKWLDENLPNIVEIAVRQEIHQLTKHLNHNHNNAAFNNGEAEAGNFDSLNYNRR